MSLCMYDCTKYMDTNEAGYENEIPYTAQILPGMWQKQRLVPPPPILLVGD